MSYDLYSYVPHDRMPTIKMIEDRIGGRVRLDLQDLKLAKGFVPVIFDGIATGFELFFLPITEERRAAHRRALTNDGQTTDELMRALLACDSQFSISCKATDTNELDAARLVATAIAELGDGWLRDPQKGEVRRYAPRAQVMFELLGEDGDSVRLLRAPEIGYSIALAGRPRIASKPTDGVAYDVVVALDDLGIEHGFRIDDMRAHHDPPELAKAIVTAYRNRRGKSESRVRLLPSAIATAGVVAGAQSMYGLKQAEQPTMEQLWVALHPSPSGLWALYHTTRFHNDEVNTIMWGHARSSFIDQHSWDPKRLDLPTIWPPSEFVLPSIRLELTESASRAAQAKAEALGELTRREHEQLMSVFREFAQQDYPPRLRVNDLLCDTVRSGIVAAGSPSITGVLLPGLYECKTRHDLHGWIWQCVWAIGRRLGAH
jgi:hypothetical protein